MKKKRILKAISLLAAVCIAAGCSASTTTETTERPLAEINSTENSEEPLFQKEFEITDWTMEELVADMTLCGVKITLPCTISDLSSNFTTEEFEHINGATGKRSKGCKIYHEGVVIALAYCDDDSDDNTITSICFDEIITNDMIIPDICVMGITDKSSSKDIVEILGEPNVNTEYSCDYRYYFSNSRHLYISFNEELSEIVYMAVVYSEN